MTPRDLRIRAAALREAADELHARFGERVQKRQAVAFIMSLREREPFAAELPAGLEEVL